MKVGEKGRMKASGVAWTITKVSGDLITIVVNCPRRLMILGGQDLRKASGMDEYEPEGAVAEHVMTEEEAYAEMIAHGFHPSLQGLQGRWNSNSIRAEDFA